MIALHTQSLNKYGLNRIFELAKEAGYDGIEIGVDKNNFDTQNAAYIGELAEKYNLKIAALHAPSTGGSKAVEHVVEMAAYLKCPVVVIPPPKFLDFKFTKWLLNNVGSLRKKKDIQIALINAPGGTTFGFLPKHRLNTIVDLKKFGMAALDCSSSSSKKWGNLMETYSHIKKNLVHVQLSNIHAHQPYSMPNKGILPLESLLQKLKNEKYKGSISVRVRPKELSAGDDDKVIENLKKAKDFIDEFYQE